MGITLFLPLCLLWFSDHYWVHYYIAKCFVFILRQYEIWTALADMKQQSILLNSNQLLKDFLSFVDMFFGIQEINLFSLTHLKELELCFKKVCQLNVDAAFVIK